MGVSTLRSSHNMTIDQFHAFVSDRPDEEKWELIEGEPVLSPSAALVHQIIVANVLYELEAFAQGTDARWLAVPGTAVIAPDDIYNAPVPDVMVAPGSDPASWKTMDSLAVFEVISPSSRSMDLRRKPPIYARSPTILDYVVVDPKTIRAVHHARDASWEPRTIRDIDEALTLASIGAKLPLASIYRRTPLARRLG
jgi:Uma2 family endonuclease